jgi:hypothetical protein
MKNSLFLSLLLLLLGNRLYSDTIFSKITVHDTVFVTMASPVLSELDAYKMLYDNAEENNRNILSTTHWAIGLSITVLLLILGSHFLYQHRINRQEIDRIQSDMQIQSSDLSAKLTESITEGMTSARAELKEANKELIKDYKEIMKLKHNSLSDKLDRDIKNLTTMVTEIEGAVWTLRGVLGNALSSYLKSALLTLDMNREVRYMLDDIIGVLSKLSEIHQMDEEKLNELTARLTDGKYEAQKQKIIELYVTKPVYTFVETKDLVWIKTFEPSAVVVGNKRYHKNHPSQ